MTLMSGHLDTQRLASRTPVSDEVTRGDENTVHVRTSEASRSATYILRPQQEDTKTPVQRGHRGAAGGVAARTSPVANWLHSFRLRLQDVCSHVD